jgi:anaerobic magnesium-protoporphyrin IX monomethyl ester cyclase
MTTRIKRAINMDEIRVTFVEPPKDFWFPMGEYIPPPFGILCLAAYLEREIENIEIKIIDSQAEGLDWVALKHCIKSSNPDIVASAGLSTCNSGHALRTLAITKEIDPDIQTIVGGQHFTALADESLTMFSQVDAIARGEGEQTLVEYVKAYGGEGLKSKVTGLSFRDGEIIRHNPERSLICDLDTLPHPGYHYVAEHMKKYYFALMAEMEEPFAIVEGSRGCRHDCSYCSQWKFWRSSQRTKSPRRVVDEIEILHKEYGSRFFWLTDDNLNLGHWTSELCDEIIKRGLSDKVTWFTQARSDAIVSNRNLLPKMRKAGNTWILVGFDTPHTQALEGFRRYGIDESSSKEAVALLRSNDIFSQGTFIIGERNDTRESIKAIREYANLLNPDIATFMTLTPFPGTEIYEKAKEKGWIKSDNWADFDMIHAVMPTESLSVEEVQEEIYNCYRSFFGSRTRRYSALFSSNPITKRTYRYMAKKALLTNLRSLFT